VARRGVAVGLPLDERADQRDARAGSDDEPRLGRFPPARELGLDGMELHGVHELLAGQQHQLRGLGLEAGLARDELVLAWKQQLLDLTLAVHERLAVERDLGTVGLARDAQVRELALEQLL